MKIVIAADSFKGSADAPCVVEHLKRGALRVCPHAQVTELPISDGGEGMLNAYLRTDGIRIPVRVTGPDGRPVQAAFGLLPDGTAVIEMAQASGITLAPQTGYNVRIASTYGTGELMRAALDSGCRAMIIGIGGSATNDGGAGMACALGARFLDKDGQPLAPGGAALQRLHRIDVSGLDPRLLQCRIVVACDVQNPLCGPNGASAVYGPQKGASKEDVALLDAALAHYARLLHTQLGKDVAGQPGAGAAGGLGAALLAFCNAQMCPGIETVLDALNFEQALSGASLVITGEGRIDSQSACGKVPVGVARRAKKAAPNVPVVAIVGSIGPGAELVYQEGIDAILPLPPYPMALAECMAQTAPLLEAAAERAMRLMMAGTRLIP